MSLPNPEKMIFGGDETRLLIDESPYQFLPSLAQILSDTGALLLQQLHYIARHPYFEGERLPTQWDDGFFFVQIPAFMWWDSIEGFLRHLSKRTFERKTSDLIKIGVLEVRNRVGHYRDRENHKWYAINYARLKELEDDHRAHHTAAKAQRERDRAEVKLASDGTAGWRPPSGEDTSRQIGGWFPPLEESPPDPPASSAPKKGAKSSVSQASRQNGERSKPAEKESKARAKMADEPRVKMAAAARVKVAAVAPAKMAAAASVKVAAPSLYKRHKETLKTTTDTISEVASLEMSPAKAGAAVESKLILSDEASSEVSLRPQRLPGIQVALPETALGVLPPTQLEPVAALAARFADVAGGEYGLPCDAELAASVVSRSPIAAMSDAAIVRLIGPDHQQGGLDKPLFGERKRELAREVPHLRWLLFVWPAHRAEVEAWAARKNRQPNLAGSFVTKWEEGTLPPREWMARQINEVRAEVKAQAVAEVERRAKAVWEGLSGPQRAALASEAQKRVDARGTGDFNRAKEQATEERRKLLLDAAFVEELRQAQSRAASEAKSRAGAAPEERPGIEMEGDAPYQPTKNERGRMELHAMKLARRLETGEFNLDGVEAAAKNEMFWGPKQALYIRELVESIVESRAVKEVA